MTEQDIHPLDRPDDGEASSDRPVSGGASDATNDGRNPRVIKAGIGVMAAGLLATICGVVLLNTGVRFEPVGNFFHRSGMITMLLGLFCVLVGVRFARVQRFLGNAHSALRPRPASIPAETRPRCRFALLHAFLIWFGICTFEASLYFLDGIGYLAMAVLLAIHLLAPSLCAVAIVYSKGYQRVMAIGAMIPLLSFLLTSAQIVPFMIGGRRYIRGNDLTSLVIIPIAVYSFAWFSGAVCVLAVRFLRPLKAGE